METILTVAFSVLGTLAVVFIVGTVVGLRKVLKDNASLKDSITGLKNDIDDVHKRIDSEHRDIMNDVVQRERETVGTSWMSVLTREGRSRRLRKNTTGVSRCLKKETPDEGDT